jgi:hypothetical protein
VELTSEDGILTLATDGIGRVATNLRGRLTEIEVARDRFAATLPAMTGEGAWIDFLAARPVSAALDDRPQALAGNRLQLFTSRAPQRLAVRLA